IFFFFFFQAEDGIRDRNVTGVQTCALPILRLIISRFPKTLGCLLLFASAVSWTAHSEISSSCAYSSLWGISGEKWRAEGRLPDRSEERRVGKECRYRWWVSDRRKENLYSGE